MKKKLFKFLNILTGIIISTVLLLPEAVFAASIEETEETGQEEGISENTAGVSENEAQEYLPLMESAFSEEGYYEDDIWFQNVKSQNLTDMGINFCFRADEMNSYRNMINLYVLVCHDSTYTYNAAGENIGKNPNLENVGLRNREFIRFYIKNSEFYFSDGRASTQAPAVLWAPSANDTLYETYDNILISRLKFFNNGDSASLYCYSFRVNDGSYLFTLPATNVNDERYATQAKQPYIFLCSNDLNRSPFIEDGFSENMLDSEYIRLEYGTRDTVNVFMMFGPPDWCYMNFKAYQEYAARISGIELAEETVDVEETEEEENLMMQPSNIIAVSPNVVESGIIEPEEEKKSSSIITYIIGILVVAVALLYPKLKDRFLPY